MDYEVTNFLSLSEHFAIVELKGLPTPFLLQDVCTVQMPEMAHKIVNSQPSDYLQVKSPHSIPQSTIIQHTPQYEQVPVSSDTVFDFDKYLESRKVCEFEAMAKVMTATVNHLALQLKACNALESVTSLGPTGTSFLHKLFLIFCKISLVWVRQAL